MRFSLSFFSFFILSQFSFSQEYKDRFLFDALPVAQIRAHEKALNSKDSGLVKVQVSSDYFRGAKENKEYFPLTFRWTNDNFNPGCVAEYFYFGSDSIARVVTYNWDILSGVSNFKTSRNAIIKQTERKEEYWNKYQSIYDLVCEKLGKPAKEDKLKQTQQGYFAFSRWKQEKKIVELYFSFTPQVQEFAGMAFGTFRVRLKIDNNKE